MNPGGGRLRTESVFFLPDEVLLVALELCVAGNNGPNGKKYMGGEFGGTLSLSKNTVDQYRKLRIFITSSNYLSQLDTKR